MITRQNSYATIAYPHYKYPRIVLAAITAAFPAMCRANASKLEARLSTLPTDAVLSAPPGVGQKLGELRESGITAYQASTQSAEMNCRLKYISFGLCQMK